MVEKVTVMTWINESDRVRWLAQDNSAQFYRHTIVMSNARWLMGFFNTFWSRNDTQWTRLFITSRLVSSYSSRNFLTVKNEKIPVDSVHPLNKRASNTSRRDDAGKHFAQAALFSSGNTLTTWECDLQTSDFWPPALDSLNEETVKSCGMWECAMLVLGPCVSRVCQRDCEFWHRAPSETYRTTWYSLPGIYLIMMDIFSTVMRF